MSYHFFDNLLPQLAFDNDIAGGSLVIFKNNECVYTNAFGQSNADNNWTDTTLSVNFSVGKGVMATLIAILVSKGLLDYDRPISHYWSEFAQNGKSHITLLDVLTHRAGLYKLSDIMTSEIEALDYQTMVNHVAKMPIATPNGQEQHQYGSAYSGLVSGWVLGGLIEKATNLPLQTALDEFLTNPLNITGQVFFGTPTEKLTTLAIPTTLFDEWATNDTPTRKKPTLKKDSPKTLDFYKNLPISTLWQSALTKFELSDLTTSNINRLYFDPSIMNMANYRDALLFDGKTPLNYYCKNLLKTPVPAANGTSTAKALATIYAMHANHGIWQEQTLINERTLAKMRNIVVNANDAVMPANMYWRAGFHRLFTIQSTPNAYGHMGYNGSVAFCDPDKQLAVAFIHNFDSTMLNDVRQFVVSESVLANL